MRSEARRLRAGASALAVLLLAGMAPLAHGQPIPPPYPPVSRHAGTLTVALNKSQVINVDRMIAKALIGNDEIADVLPINERSVYVLGKKVGTTSLTLIDGSGRVLSIMDIAVGPDVDSLSSQLRMLVPGEDIKAGISNDAIVLTGLVNDPGAIDRAVQLARTYAGDKVVNLIGVGSSQQVMLEVRFAEVNRSSGFDIGVSGFTNGNTFSSATGKGASLVPGAPSTVTTTVGGTTVTSTVPSGGILQLSSITGAFGIFRNRFNIGSLSIDAVLNALETKGLSKTLAQPTLLALSGQKASFLAGGEFPVPVVQGGGGGATAGGGNGAAITVEFKPFGVGLAFTPTVLGDKTINLLVEPEVSAIDPSASYTVGNISIPGLRTRRASTTLELRDGESFAIAGLISKDFQTTVNQVPLLGSIPILGSLFRSSAFKKGETELLIVVTPHLVSPLTEDQVHLPTDAVADPSGLESTLLGTSGRKRELPAAPGLGSGKAANARAQTPSEAATKEPSYAY